MKQISGNKLLVKALKEEGVEYLFGYPGACTIDISDELYKQNDVKVILPRHEQALVHEADAYARTTGKVGVCLVTSGPGATNLVTGLATANYDSVPLVCFTGQVARHLIGNDAFQEVDIVGITRSITKYGVTVRRREDLGRIIKEAFYIARTGRPGPVLIDLPKDVMAELGSAEYPKNVNIRGYKPNTDVHIGQLKRALKLLHKAKRPLFLAGGGVVISRAHEIFREAVEKTNVPVVTTVMGKGAIPTDHPLYIGNLGMHGAYAANMAVSNCDVLFSIGTRFNDRITGKLHEFAPHAQIIHIDIDTASISRNIQVDIPIVADAKEAITKMNEYVQECATGKWLDQIKKWKQEHPLVMRPNDVLSPMDILKEINNQFENSIIVTDVGQHQMLVSQYAEVTEGKQMIMSGGLGTMGYGLPGGIGAKIGNPDRPVIVISGDGGVQMNIQELATAVLEELPVILCIFNNEYLGMVRQWQKLFYGKRYAMTNLRAGALSRRTEGMEYPQYTPDFIKLAESYRAKGIRVTKKEEIAAAFEEAKKGKTVSMICSGDAGVYGMAGLMYEVGVNYPETELEIIPGVTAATGGAAVLGAPLIHDFCLISLSDLLTPWEKIEARLLAAAQADFVVCLYNPSSKKRHDYLQKACDLMMKYKSPDTICGTVSNIAREGEEAHVMTLKELRDTQVDMFTTVFIGNSQTKEINGKMVTPRGYRDV